MSYQAHESAEYTGQPVELYFFSHSATEWRYTSASHEVAPPDFQIAPGMVATRMAKCRLDHDAVDLIWHTDGVLEVNLVFHELPVTYRAMVGGYNF